MKTNLKRLCAIALVAAMSVSAFASCSNGTGTSESTSTASESASTSSEETTGDGGVPLVVAYDTFNQKFNPFFSTVQYDSDVATIACEPLIGNDRSGAIIYNGIEGETHSYNGTDYTYKTLSDVTVDQGEDTTTYTIKLREGVKFADGEELTADDVIFSYYVYLDPTYDGATTLYSEDIVGLQEYRTQTSSEVYEKYNTMFDYFQANGDAGEYGDEMLANYNQAVTDTWKADLQGIVDGVMADYGSIPRTTALAASPPTTCPPTRASRSPTACSCGASPPMSRRRPDRDRFRRDLRPRKRHLPHDRRLLCDRFGQVPDRGGL